MTCQRCDSPCRGGLCNECELELAHGTPETPDSEWAVRQTGLGDRDAAGQTTLSGGIVPESDNDE
jgi:hypothetical protein